MRTPLLGEVFDKLRGQDPSKQATILQNLVQEFPSTRIPLFTWLAIAFHQDIKFALPEGMPPYKVGDAPAGLSETNLWMATKKVKLFLQVKEYAHVAPKQRETAFIQLLENLDPLECELLGAIKAKALIATYGLARATVIEAFPALATELGPVSFVVEGASADRVATKVAPKKKLAKKKKSKPVKKAVVPTSSEGSEATETEAPPTTIITPEAVEASGGLLNALRNAIKGS